MFKRMENGKDSIRNKLPTGPAIREGGMMPENLKDFYKPSRPEVAESVARPETITSNQEEMCRTSKLREYHVGR